MAVTARKGHRLSLRHQGGPSGGGGALGKWNELWHLALEPGCHDEPQADEHEEHRRPGPRGVHPG
jgi:hypothetical protein